MLSKEEVRNIQTLPELMIAAQITKGGGYDVTLAIQIEKNVPIGSGFIILDVTTNLPSSTWGIDGRWWFTQDGTIVQVL